VSAWCLRKILRISYTRHTTNETVRSITGCLPVSDRVNSLRLRFFGHLARSAPEEDHHRVIAAALRPPTDWRRPVGRPRTTWLRTIDEEVEPPNFGVHTAWRKARDRQGRVYGGEGAPVVRKKGKRMAWMPPKCTKLNRFAPIFSKISRGVNTPGLPLLGAVASSPDFSPVPLNERPPSHFFQSFRGRWCKNRAIAVYFVLWKWTGQ